MIQIELCEKLDNNSVYLLHMYLRYCGVVKQILSASAVSIAVLSLMNVPLNVKQ